AAEQQNWLVEQDVRTVRQGHELRGHDFARFQVPDLDASGAPVSIPRIASNGSTCFVLLVGFQNTVAISSFAVHNKVVRSVVVYTPRLRIASSLSHVDFTSVFCFSVSANTSGFPNTRDNSVWMVWISSRSGGRPSFSHTGGFSASASLLVRSKTQLLMRRSFS